MRIDIPASTTAGLGCFKLETPRGDERMDEVVVEGESYSVFCKRGRRGSSMEDRYSALLGFNGDSSKVLINFLN